MHHQDNVNQNTSKPEIIGFYNSTKGRVDSLDQKCAAYSSNRSQRWPTTIFCAILNIFGINNYVLWKGSNPQPNMSRRQFIEAVALDLVKPHVRTRRSSLTHITKDLKDLMDKF